MPVLVPLAAAVIDIAITSSSLVAGITIFGITLGTFGAAIVGALAAFSILAIGQATGILGGAQKQTLTVRNPVASHAVIAGQMKVGGAITFIDCSSDNQTLFMVVTLAGHQVHSVDALYINDTYVPLNSSGQAQEPAIWPDGVKPTNYTNHVQAIYGLGTVAGDANFLSQLTTADANWGTNFFQYSRGKVYIRLGWNQNLFGATGIPNVSCVVRGRMVYDPRNTGILILDSVAGAPGVFNTATAHGLSAGMMVFIKDHSGALATQSQSSWPTAQAHAVAQEYEIDTVPSDTSFTLLGPDSQPLELSVGGSGGTVTQMQWSDNSALVLNDYLVEPYHGMAVLYDSEVDENQLIYAANICDEIEARFTLSTTFTADPTENQIIYVVNNTIGPLPPLCQVVLSNVGGSLPEGLSPNTPYYFAQVGAGPIGVLCTSSANAAKHPPNSINLSSTGSGTNTLTIVESLDFNIAGTDTAISVYDNSLRITTGCQVQLYNYGGAPPSGLSTGVVYYAILISDTVIELAATLEDARNDNTIHWSGSGSGTTFIEVLGEPRYTANGVINTEEARQTVIQKLLTSMGGYLVPSGVALNIWPAAYLSPNVTLDEGDLRGPIQVIALQSGSESFNSVKGTFIDPFNRGQPTDFPYLQNQTYIEEDFGEVVWRDLTLDFTNSNSMAQRLAKIELERIRRELTVTMPLKLTAFQVGSPDVIAVNNTQLGWEDETFEVSTWNFSIGEKDNQATLDCDIVGRQTDAAVFAWTAAEESAAMRQKNTNLPNPFVVAPPTNLTLQSGGSLIVQQPDGTLVSRIEVSWTSPVDEFVLSGGFIECQYSPTGLNQWQSAATVPGDQTITYIENAAIGAGYDIAVRARNAIGSVSDLSANPPWQCEVVDYVVQGKNVAPSNIASLSVSENGMTLTLSGSPITDTDIRCYEYRYGSSENYATMNVIGQQIAVPNGSGGVSGTMTTGNVPAGTWYFGVCAVNTSGLYSAVPAYASFTFSNQIDGGSNILDGSITDLQFAAGIQPVKILSGAPPSTPGTYVGELAVSTTDSQVYRWTGSAWTADVPAVNITGLLTASQIDTITAAQLTGQITTTQISNNSISTALLQAGSVLSANIGAGTIVAANIQAATITGTEVAAGTLLGNNIAANTLTSGNIATDAIQAGQIAVGAVNATAIIVDDIIVTGHLQAYIVTEGNYAQAGSQTISNTTYTPATLVSVNYTMDPAGSGDALLQFNDYFVRSSGHSPTVLYRFFIDDGSGSPGAVEDIYSGGSSETFNIVTAMTYLATGLTPGQNYTFELQAATDGSDPSCTSQAATIIITEYKR